MEEQIRDQLINKCRSHDLRKKLLAVNGKLTPQKARDVARSMATCTKCRKGGPFCQSLQVTKDDDFGPHPIVKWKTYSHRRR